MRVSVSEAAARIPGHVRIVGRVTSNAGAFDVWYEVPAESAVNAHMRGNPWLIALLPYALNAGEPIELDLPVDPALLENACGLAETWRIWYPELRSISIIAPTQRAQPSAGLAAQFFSGGVDSWFTLLRHTESAPGWPQVGDVDDLLTVWGFDIPIDSPGQFSKMAAAIDETARERGKRHRVIATNLRARRHESWTRTWGPDWGRLSHGAGLASAALLMEHDYERVLIPGSVTVAGTLKWGSHPMMDPLFSTSALSFSHDHIVYGRSAKVARIAMSKDALARLRVCYEEGRADNCSRCGKCHRTLMCLDAVGALDRAASFDVDLYRSRRHRLLLALTESDRDLIEDMIVLMKERGRRDLLETLHESLRRSAKIGSIVPRIRRLSWRIGEAVWSRLTSDMIV